MREITTKQEAKAYLKSAAIAIVLCLVVMGGWALMVKAGF